MTLLQTLKCFLMLLYCSLKLLDILGPAFSEGGLRLAIPLFAFF